MDTPIALWIAEGSDGLSSKVVDIAENPDNNLYVSAAAIWEIAIKRSKGNLKLHPRDARSAFHLAGIAELRSRENMPKGWRLSRIIRTTPIRLTV
ncbi:MAG: hypothetical protein AAAB35_18585 [Phyllobacterium sp.]|uniref:hypothetical protein n=1 Tax=Phyllobacterium sp. TaxID=1871046 RepID=UPI0030F11CA4